jgi:hypothetical protein
MTLFVVTQSRYCDCKKGYVVTGNAAAQCMCYPMAHNSGKQKKERNARYGLNSNRYKKALSEIETMIVYS